LEEVDHGQDKQYAIENAGSSVDFQASVLFWHIANGHACAAGKTNLAPLLIMAMIR